MTVANARATAASRRSRLVVKAAQLLGGKKVNKVVLAYSGGLDTSVILTWLKETYDCEVVTFTADLGQVCTAEHLQTLARQHFARCWSEEHRGRQACSMP